jgi:hypothetical protein
MSYRTNPESVARNSDIKELTKALAKVLTAKVTEKVNKSPGRKTIRRMNKSLCALCGSNSFTKRSIYLEFFILNFALILSVYQDEFIGVNEREPVRTSPTDVHRLPTRSGNY